MGAAIPVVGAVVGAASTVSQISASKKQAQAQADAIGAQQEATYQNTQLRLIELQRQKQYAQHLATIDDAKRAQVKLQDDAELSVAQLKDQLVTSSANIQNQQQYGLGNTQNTNQYALANQATQNASVVGNAQLGNQQYMANAMNQLDYNSQVQAANFDFNANRLIFSIVKC